MDLPEYIDCHCCDTLYQWKAASGLGYGYPRRFRGMSLFRIHAFPQLYCRWHPPYLLRLGTVAAFLRGYERGPDYGPHLQELHHKCDDKQVCWSWTRDVSRETAVRVVNGKLLLRTSCSLRVSLRQSLAAQVAQLGYIGYTHTTFALPNLAMDEINHLSNPSKASRCSDYINCAECATDLGVAILAPATDQ